MLAVCALGLGPSAPGQTGSGNTGSSRLMPLGPMPDTAYSNALEWFFFPTNPPPLGAEVAVVAASRQTGTPEALRAFLTDPFFTPLAVRLVHVPGEVRRGEPLGIEEYVKLDSFLRIRAALVSELYDRADRFLRLGLEERIRSFENLAGMQDSRLVELEQTAEWLRGSLARTDRWSEHRGWRLNRGGMRQPREKTYALEFQVVRAAAYYQPGFSTAQRRLIRELAIEMNETLATHGQAGGGSFLFFFSPETTRIAQPDSASPELQALIDRYLEEKRRLKDELRDVIYETDGMLLEAARTARIEQLATAQAQALDEVEVLAERIRRGLVLLPDYRRYRRPALLDARIEEQIEAFTAATRKIAKERAEYITKRVMKSRQDPGAAPGAAYETAANARSAFEIEHAGQLMALERMAETLAADLIRELPPEEAGRLNGPPDVAVRDYLERRAEQDAYADYDLAALEPGLSPAQRRLLLAAAMARLRQVLLPPEIQPTRAPATLLGVGK